MAKKKELSEEIKLLKTKVQEGKVIIGADRVLKNLSAKKFNKVFLASNCPPKVRGDVLSYAKLAGTPVIELSQSNEELGVVCKKNFFISVLGIIGE